MAARILRTGERAQAVKLTTCHTRLGGSWSLDTAHKASLRRLTATARTRGCCNDFALAIKAAGGNNQISEEPAEIAVAALAGARNRIEPTASKWGLYGKRQLRPNG